MMTGSISARLLKCVEGLERTADILRKHGRISASYLYDLRRELARCAASVDQLENALDDMVVADRFHFEDETRI